MAAQVAANGIFKTQIAPLRAEYEANRKSATTKTQLRQARAAYGSAILPAKLERKAAMAKAKAQHVEALERARVQFLSDSGASASTWAAARYQQSLHAATSEYRIAVSTARSAYRMSMQPLRASLRDGLAAASTAAEADQVRSRFRLDSADATGVLQLQIRQARDAYLTKVSIAKNHLRASAA